MANSSRRNDIVVVRCPDMGLIASARRNFTRGAEIVRFATPDDIGLAADQGTIDDLEAIRREDRICSG